MDREPAQADWMTNYREFWPKYLRQHAKAHTRALHYAGTTLAIMFLAMTPWIGRPGPLIAALVGYGLAWAGHFFIEKNRPGTLRHPVWSLISDFRMFGLWLLGRLDRHLVDAGIGKPGHGQAGS